MKKILIRLSALAVIAGVGLLVTPAFAPLNPQPPYDTNLLQDRPDRAIQPLDSPFGDGLEPSQGAKAKKPAVADPLSMPPVTTGTPNSGIQSPSSDISGSQNFKPTPGGNQLAEPPKMPDWLKPWWEAMKNIVPGSEFANLPGGKEVLGVIIARLNKLIVQEQIKDNDGKPNNLEAYEKLKAQLQNIYNSMPDDD